MTEQNKAIAAIALHAALVDRFVEVLDGAPFWKGSSIWNPEYARVSIEGDEATITWPEAESGWEGSCSLEQRDYSIPAELLFISSDELAKWKVDQRAIYDREQEEKRQATIRENEAKERAALAALKAKYGE